MQSREINSFVSVHNRNKEILIMKKIHDQMHLQTFSLFALHHHFRRKITKKKEKAQVGAANFCIILYIQEGLINNKRVGICRIFLYVTFHSRFLNEICEKYSYIHLYPNNYRFAINKYFVVHFILHSLGKMIHFVALY
jgi:hypothetical protein